MRVNRRYIAEAIKLGLPLSQSMGRCTGHTTVLALRAVADAIECGGATVAICDHHPTRAADLNLMYQVNRIVDLLALDKFETNSTDMTVKCTFTEYLS